jgi:hypothetical protein
MRIAKLRSLLMIIAIIIITVSIGISCGSPGSQQTQDDRKDGETLLTDEEFKELEQAIAEEEADTTDYSSVTAGAEFYGYIPSYLCTDTDNYIKVTVTNTSDFTWRAQGTNKVRFGYHYYGQDVDFSEYDKTARSALPEKLEPGDSAEVLVLINDITEPGTYVVQIDLALEGHWWFSSKDIPILEERVYFNSCTEDRYEDE